MKTKISYSLLAVAMACGLAHGQTTAYTVPVGYTTLGVAANSDSNISIPLQASQSWAGVSTGIGINTVSVASGSYVSSAYASTHMLQVTSGPLIGRTFSILLNDTGSVTVDPQGSNSLQAQGFVSGNKFVIRPFWTLNTLFPSGTGIGQNADPFSPATLLLLNDNNAIGLNRGATAFYFYYDGIAGGDAGWYKNGALEEGLQNNIQLPPSSVVTVRNLTASPLDSVLITGEVHSVAAATLVVSDTVANDSLAQLSFPVDTSLAQSKLFESGGVTASPDPFSPTDVVFIFDPSSTGLDPAAAAGFFYYDGVAGGDAGWYKNGALEEGLKDSELLLKAGTSIIIRKGVAPTFQANTWTAPLPYTVQ